MQQIRALAITSQCSMCLDRIQAETGTRVFLYVGLEEVSRNLQTESVNAVPFAVRFLEATGTWPLWTKYMQLMSLFVNITTSDSTVQREEEVNREETGEAGANILKKRSSGAVQQKAMSKNDEQTKTKPGNRRQDNTGKTKETRIPREERKIPQERATTTSRCRIY